jgi:putative ABC transport system ATP-binding protein
MIRTESLTKQYLSGGQPLTVLKNITFEIAAGEIVAVVGPSGSGKTTLLGLMAGLDRPSSGRVVMDGQDLSQLSEDGLARFRGERVGFVFQSFHLLPTLTARENVEVPLELRGERGGPRANELLARVGLQGREHHYPAQLSGGEQQRVALARAFSNRPRILFADEPTGNLDGTTGARVVEIMLELNREFGTTTVLVTHDMDLARKARRIIRLADGAVVEDTAGKAEAVSNRSPASPASSASPASRPVP